MKKTILLCDDETDIRDVLEMLIEVEFEVNIVHANNGAEAMEIYDSREDIDLIICDFNMPIKNGKDLHEHNKSHKNLPFLLLSGDDIVCGFCEELLETNPLNSIINKPWHEEEIFNKLRPLLAA
jgi:CheY-like chemotaxis protein